MKTKEYFLVTCRERKFSIYATNEYWKTKKMKYSLDEFDDLRADYIQLLSNNNIKNIKVTKITEEEVEIA